MNVLATSSVDAAIVGGRAGTRRRAEMPSL